MGRFGCRDVRFMRYVVVTFLASRRFRGDAFYIGTRCARCLLGLPYIVYWQTHLTLSRFRKKYVLTNLKNKNLYAHTYVREIESGKSGIPLECRAEGVRFGH